jgi:hypothetical protein
MTGHLVSRFDQVGEQAFAVIAGPRIRQEEVRGLLSQAGWRELEVPDELRTHPQAARSWLEAERARLTRGFRPRMPGSSTGCANSSAHACTRRGCASPLPGHWPRRH